MDAEESVEERDPKLESRRRRSRLQQPYYQKCSFCSFALLLTTTIRKLYYARHYIFPLFQTKPRLRCTNLDAVDHFYGTALFEEQQYSIQLFCTFDTVSEISSVKVKAASVCCNYQVSPQPLPTFDLVIQNYMREEVQFALSSFCTKIATTISKLRALSYLCRLSLEYF